MKETVIRSLASVGIDLRKTRNAMRDIPYFFATLREYRRSQNGPEFKVELKNLYPILTDRRDSAGSAGGHYFHQDLWAAKRIFANRPESHYDVGSRVDGFIAHLLTFMQVSQIDIRPLKSTVAGLHFVQDDATMMRSFADNSVHSLSSLHVVEHFGLGRYGDPVDHEAWKRALHSFSRILAPSGHLYLSMPVGRERLEFNAQRVLLPKSVLRECQGLRLLSFGAILDDGCLSEDIELSAVSNQDFACGLFEFTKEAE